MGNGERFLLDLAVISVLVVLPFIFAMIHNPSLSMTKAEKVVFVGSWGAALLYMGYRMVVVTGGWI